MKRTSVLLLLLVLALALTACGRKPPAPLGADAPADNVPEIIGEYGLNGEDATHEQYGGSLFITAGSQPGEYHLQWLVSGDIQEGVGTLAGNQLTFTWKSVEGTDQSLSGYGTYTVTVNGELYGERFVDGVTEPGIESVYPNPK